MLCDLPPPDWQVGEPYLLDRRRLVEVSAIEDGPFLGGLCKGGEVPKANTFHSVTMARAWAPLGRRLR